MYDLRNAMVTMVKLRFLKVFTLTQIHKSYVDDYNNNT